MHIPILAWVLAAYLLLLAIVSVYVVCSLWPNSEKLTAETEQIQIFTCSVPVGRETHILLIVLAMGLVGGCAYELWILRERSPRRHEARRAEAEAAGADALRPGVRHLLISPASLRNEISHSGSPSVRP